MSETLNINTTQNVRLNFEIASLGDRVLACILDQLIIWGFYILTVFLMGSLELMSSSVMIMITCGALFYHLLFEVFNGGRSIGKMVMKTKVVRLDGTEPHIGDFVLRWLLGIIEVVGTNGAIALFAHLLGGKGQRLGDMAAGTTVAKIKKRVTLEETLFEEVKDDYMPAYTQAEQLTDADIETVKEVLQIRGKNYTVQTILLIEKTKDTIEQKLQVKSAEQDSVSFLQRIIKDYNYLTGKE